MCKMDYESFDHLFLHCSLAVQLWSKFLKEFGLSWVWPGQCKTLFQFDAGFHGSGSKIEIVECGSPGRKK